MQTIAAAVAVGIDNQQLIFTYDYLNFRVRKQENQIVGGLWEPKQDTLLVYEGWNVIQEAWDVFNAAGTTVTASHTRTYTWGLDLVGSLSASGGVGALLGIHDTETSKRYLAGYDGNGNLTTLLDAANGDIEAAYEYGPYGESLRAQGDYAKKNSFRFSTKYTDDETGLVYYGRRYYDSHNGRFVGRDPIEEQGGLNLYAFVANNTVNRWDYLGMEDLVDSFSRWRHSADSPYDRVSPPSGMVIAMNAARAGRAASAANRPANAQSSGPTGPAVSQKAQDAANIAAMTTMWTGVQSSTGTGSSGDSSDAGTSGDPKYAGTYTLDATSSGETFGGYIDRNGAMAPVFTDASAFRADASSTANSVAPNNAADDIARYGEIRAAPDRVGPPIPLTVKNLAAVFLDAVAKAIVGAATIGNYFDPPRGNLREIGTGFGIARTAAGDALGVDVNNPRFGVASDILAISISVAGMPRGGQAKLLGETVTVFRVEGVPNARIIIDGAGRVLISDGERML
jgi:RHS repeat-associated protein